MILCMPSRAEDGPYLAYMWQISATNHMYFAYMWHLNLKSPGVNVGISTFTPGLSHIICHT